MEVIQAFEDSNILHKGITKKIENETKKQEGGFLGTLVGTLGSILLGNLLSGSREMVRHTLEILHLGTFFINRLKSLVVPFLMQNRGKIYSPLQISSES